MIYSLVAGSQRDRTDYKQEVPVKKKKKRYKKSIIKIEQKMKRSRQEEKQ